MSSEPAWSTPSEALSSVKEMWDREPGSLDAKFLATDDVYRDKALPERGREAVVLVSSIALFGWSHSTVLGPGGPLGPMVRDYAQLQEVAEYAIRICLEIGFERGAAAARMVLGYALEKQGRDDEAAEFYRLASSVGYSHPLLLDRYSLYLERHGELDACSELVGAYLANSSDPIPPAVVKRLSRVDKRRGLSGDSLIAWTGAHPREVASLRLEDGVNLLGNTTTYVAGIAADGALVRASGPGILEIVRGGFDDPAERFNWHVEPLGWLLGVRQRYTPPLDVDDHEAERDSTEASGESIPSVDLKICDPSGLVTWSQSTNGKLRGVWRVGRTWVVGIDEVGLVGIGPESGVLWACVFFWGTQSGTWTISGPAALDEWSQFTRDVPERPFLIDSEGAPIEVSRAEIEGASANDGEGVSVAVGWANVGWPRLHDAHVFTDYQGLKLTALDVLTGVRRWRRALREPLEAVVANEEIVCAIDLEYVHVLSSPYGEPAHTFAHHGAGKPAAAGLLSDGLLVLGWEDRVAVFDQDGHPKWSFPGRIRPDWVWGAGYGRGQHFGECVAIPEGRSVVIGLPDGQVARGMTARKATWGVASSLLVCSSGREIVWLGPE